MIIKEKELKLLLDKKTYDYILSCNKSHNKPIYQKNYYFDTPDFVLNEQSMTLRIRREEKMWILCLKVKDLKDSSQVIKSSEITSFITEKNFKECLEIPSRICDLLPKIGSDLLKKHREKILYLGSISNKRTPIEEFGGFSFDLDHSVFPSGREYFELEVEEINQVSEIDGLRKNLEEAGLSFSLNNKSKYKRFIESVKESMK